MSTAHLQLATAPLREARRRIVDRLGGIAERLPRLAELPPAAGREARRALVGELEAALTPHLRWEERTVHPVVDKYACEGPAAFSSSMRYEHEIIYRWISEVRELADGEALPFARRADNLLGVVLAHFELEEHVLFPVLDRSMTADAFHPAQPGVPG